MHETVMGEVNCSKIFW